MNLLRRCWVWLSRIHRSAGFGIQSPTDYAFVREVINEHWPYYAYGSLKADDWLGRKLGRLYLRLANWRRPMLMQHDAYEQWWQAGSRKTVFVDRAQVVELARMDIADDWETMVRHCDKRSVVVVEHLYHDWPQWHHIEHDGRVGTTFDLYYCGIVLFDQERYPHHYKVNF